MTLGFVTPDFKAAVHVYILTPNGKTVETEVFVDTGFNGFLSLPRAFLDDLGLSPVDDLDVELADGSKTRLPIYESRVMWNEDTLPVSIIATEGDPLLGMMLLEGNALKIEVKTGGAVTIEPLT